MGQGRDNPFDISLKNGSYYAFRASFGIEFKFASALDFHNRIKYKDRFF